MAVPLLLALSAIACALPRNDAAQEPLEGFALVPDCRAHDACVEHGRGAELCCGQVFGQAPSGARQCGLCLRAGCVLRTDACKVAGSSNSKYCAVCAASAELEKQDARIEPVTVGKQPAARPPRAGLRPPRIPSPMQPRPIGPPPQQPRQPPGIPMNQRKPPSQPPSRPPQPRARPMGPSKPPFQPPQSGSAQGVPTVSVGVKDTFPDWFTVPLKPLESKPPAAPGRKGGPMPFRGNLPGMPPFRGGGVLGGKPLKPGPMGSQPQRRSPPPMPDSARAMLEDANKRQAPPKDTSI